MRDTIKAKNGYVVRHFVGMKVEGYKEPCALRDGEELVMLADLRPYHDYVNEVMFGGNEAARMCEKFTTSKGNEFIYWRDEEADEDYLSKMLEVNY